LGKKKYDIPAEKAKRMSAKDILREIKKGKTVSGYSDFLDEHYGRSMVRDVKLKDIEKAEKQKGSFWYEGTVQTGKAKSVADTARMLFGKGKAAPPPGRNSWW
jgi:hypothetical protein